MAVDNSKNRVHPSPGNATRLLWEVTASCNMVAEDNDHTHTDQEQQTPIEDNLLTRSDSTEMLIQSTTMDDIFDVIKSG